MSLSNVLLIYRARLRARAVLVQEAFAIVGIAVGVALLFATQVAGTSLTRSVQALTTEVVGNTQLQLDARGPEGFEGRLLGQVRSVPGVTLALPVLEQRANVSGPRGQRAVDLIGTDPRFARLGGSLLRRFSSELLAGQRAIALPAPIAAAIGVGLLQTTRLQIAANVQNTLLGATLGERDIGGLENSPIGFAPVPFIQHLDGLGDRITEIFVKLSPGRQAQARRALSALAARAGLNLEPADFASTLFAEAVAPDSRSQSLFSGISALVGFLFALDAMLIAIPSRRKLIQDLRPSGASRVMIVQVLMFDALVIGVIACVVGLMLGDALSVLVFHATPGYLSSAFPVGNDRIVTWKSAAIAVGAGLTATVVGVFWPLRDLFSRPSSISTRGTHRALVALRLAMGIVCLAIPSMVLLLKARVAVLDNALLVVALVCLLPFAFDGGVALFALLQQRFRSAATRLAVTELRSRHTRVRSLAIALTAAVAVFGAVEFQGLQANLTAGLDVAARSVDTSAGLWVTPGGEFSAFAATPFRAPQALALKSVVGVRAVRVYRGSFMNWATRRLWVLAPPSGASGQIVRVSLADTHGGLAARRVREGGWAVLSQALADEHSLRVGQSFLLPAPRPLRLRVAGLSSNMGWAPGAVIMNSADYARGWPSEEASAYEIELDPGASPRAVRDLVRRQLGSNTGLVVETAAERERRTDSSANQGLSRLAQIRRLVLIAAVLAVVGAIAAMLWQRRDRVAFNKCEGYSRGVLLRWLLCESAVLLALGSSIGAVFGVYAALLGSTFLAGVTGFPIVIDVQALAALGSLALFTCAALAAVCVPGYIVVRVPPRTVSPAF